MEVTIFVALITSSSSVIFVKYPFVENPEEFVFLLRTYILKLASKAIEAIS